MKTGTGSLGCLSVCAGVLTHMCVTESLLEVCNLVECSEEGDAVGKPLQMDVEVALLLVDDTLPELPKTNV